jgi:hypothetical protein
VVTNARRPFHAQTSLLKWALHQKCRYSLQVQLRFPVMGMVTGINSGSGPWYSRSRAGHSCEQLFTLLSAYVTISSLYSVTTCVRQSLCCHVTPLHCFYSLFLFISSKCMVLCLSCLSSQFPHCHHNQSPNQHVDCCIHQIVLFACVPSSVSPRFRTPLFYC